MAKHHKYYIAIAFLFWLSLTIMGYKFIKRYEPTKTEFEACVEWHKKAVAMEKPDVSFMDYQYIVNYRVEQFCSLN